MANPRRKKMSLMQPRKRKVAINVKQSVSITKKRDSTRVDSSRISRPDTLKKVPTEIMSNGVVFRVKVKKK